MYVIKINKWTVLFIYHVGQFYSSTHLLTNNLTEAPQ